MTQTQPGGKLTLRNLGGAQALRQFAEQYERDKAWLEANRDHLLKEYEESWVAVRGGEVIAAHRNIDDLVRKLRDEGQEPLNMVIEYVTRRKMTLLL